MGVGQYQHDVNQSRLKERLDQTVMSCVNSVGVNVNMASPELLSYVSGISRSLADQIVRYRSEKGTFSRREELKQVPRLGDKAFEQCAGFLRIPDGINPLDASAVHPESYGLVNKMAEKLGVPVGQLIANENLLKGIRPADFVDSTTGQHTVNDIILELKKPDWIRGRKQGLSNLPRYSV
ncbi:MAG: helix-hairpin-helix domain-containing protein [Ferruginibacter sp.]